MSADTQRDTQSLDTHSVCWMFGIDLLLQHAAASFGEMIDRAKLTQTVVDHKAWWVN